MAGESTPKSPNETSPQPPARRRYSASSGPSGARNSPYRLTFRLLGIPVLAVAGVFLYRGLQPYFALPECDSANAKRTLAEVLKQLNLEPTRYEPIKTVSTSKDEVVCNAALPLPDGGTVVIDYTFYWQGSKANMRYSIRRQPAQHS